MDPYNQIACQVLSTIHIYANFNFFHAKQRHVEVQHEK